MRGIRKGNEEDCLLLTPAPHLPQSTGRGIHKPYFGGVLYGKYYSILVLIPIHITIVGRLYEQNKYLAKECAGRAAETPSGLFLPAVCRVVIPIVVGITALGLFLKSLFPSPNALHLAAGTCAFILLVPILMCVGAWCWLLMARRVVQLSVVQAFAVHPGFGILSRVSKWMFVSVYGDDDIRHAQPSDEPNGAPPHRLS